MTTRSWKAPVECFRFWAQPRDVGGQYEASRNLGVRLEYRFR
jgi:hypothetical protein